ncbi:cytochrome ubiquinol oxidase subunit I [Dysgonomonas sp. BGC7]|uniref:cytochrome ubiquinol oxidase subunit I n=1 Tax=Dysgonomonas sp. BGC7 TaxID=1658008 RepID=UPI0006803970|nr:cytochrome ubiquinol oxidase subunit I [Dysgonomonas sp. BGC7]MBD8389073.1 cytochrome ubiquinol oxidase subunit I [Dysgonomonas sp. BGC7]
MELLSTSLIDWSRAQFALTAMYHWLFVPLTLGLGLIMAIMETMYVRTGNEQWKKTAKFWMTLFGINFAIGIATGLILEFQFGTNWSNYSFFVGDIFGAPLAIEATVAFFMEATFISIMFFGWKRVSKGVHLAATWLTITGATISALWILIANAWMQYPVGMEFNADTSRNEMVDFFAVALSPVAINKFFHTVVSSWILGSAFVIGVAAWYLLKKRDKEFAMQSLKVATVFGLCASLLTLYSGHGSAVQVAEKQPMKLAVMEGLYKGGTNEGLIIFGIPNPSKESYNDGKEEFIFPPVKFPGGLSLIAFYDTQAFVPGINDIIEGGYTKPDGTTALSFEEMRTKGRVAIQALTDYRKAKADGDEATAILHKGILKDNFAYFGYGYLENPEQLVPNLAKTVYWAFHIMVYLGGYFILFFAVLTFLVYRKINIEDKKWLLWICIWTIPLTYVASQAGWMVAEIGRQPWAIQDVMPLQAAVSAISTMSVVITFFVFLALFTALLIAEIRIMLNQIRKGPEGAH